MVRSFPPKRHWVFALALFGCFRPMASLDSQIGPSHAFVLSELEEDEIDCFGGAEPLPWCAGRVAVISPLVEKRIKARNALLSYKTKSHQKNLEVARNALSKAITKAKAGFKAWWNVPARTIRRLGAVNNVFCYHVVNSRGVLSRHVMLPHEKLDGASVVGQAPANTFVFGTRVFHSSSLGMRWLQVDELGFSPTTENLGRKEFMPIQSGLKLHTKTFLKGVFHVSLPDDLHRLFWEHKRCNPDTVLRDEYFEIEEDAQDATQRITDAFHANVKVDRFIERSCGLRMAKMYLVLRVFRLAGIQPEDPKELAQVREEERFLQGMLRSQRVFRLGLPISSNHTLRADAHRIMR